MPRTIEGYASVFYREGDAGSEYRLAQDVVERIMPTAFDRVLATNAEVVALWNHASDYLLGRRSAGTLKLSKDIKGLRYIVDYNDDDPQHQSIYAKLRRGDVIGSSFSFTIRDEKVRRTKTGYVRELHDVNLIEVSPVWRPAYESTTAQARQFTPGAVRGSVRWVMEHPHSPEACQSRLRQLERDQVEDRLRIIELG